MDLVEQVLALDAALSRARIPHAFGGALALAYWTEEPRGTRDIDCNLFVPATDSAPVLAALPPGVEVPLDGRQIPVLGPRELVVFKALFDRTKDWADIEAVLASGAATEADLANALVAVVGPDDPRLAKLADAARRAVS